ncbi:Ground-like domain-containing protein [Caenorhabditis elegans]|uniref:Ground-like domain-containing protein n=1 Tax=Caenorhabditis elegans TaxID=6239 RepID=O02154_CAEEL|nr:Ground-like domain-containing protein [Caenorhabditis elegans]CCD69595.1 Ground-like domain-containing protein [Caenorhabditis elegans]|eukprot:NP_001294835.1 GRounDhog (hedgehog-like family) [Caenorhabditis elegans]
MKLILLLIGFAAVAVQGQDDNCPSMKSRKHAKSGDLYCCDSTIKTVIKRGIRTLSYFGDDGPQTLGPIVQGLSTYVQRHYGVAYEIVLAPKGFILNSNYNGSSVCKFETNSYTMAVYETPEHYDVNGPGEAYYYHFAANDKLRIPSVSSHLKKFSGLVNTVTERDVLRN